MPTPNPNPSSKKEQLQELLRAGFDHIEQARLSGAELSPEELLNTVRQLRDTFRESAETGLVPTEAGLAFSPDVPLADRRQFISMTGEKALPTQNTPEELEGARIALLAALDRARRCDDGTPEHARRVEELHLCYDLTFSQGWIHPDTDKAIAHFPPLLLE